jgi:hypothetical protein
MVRIVAITTEMSDVISDFSAKMLVCLKTNTVFVSHFQKFIVITMAHSTDLTFPPNTNNL